MKNIIVTVIRTYLRFFARKSLQKNKPIIIGITGSAGKSSARSILYGILKDHFRVKVVAENSEIGIPLGILNLKPKSLGFATLFYSIMNWLRIVILAPFSTGSLRGIQYLIIEMGIDDPYPPKNMEYLLTIVKPDIAILLNAAPIHTMQFEKLLTPNSHSELASESDEKSTRNKFGMTDQQKIDLLVSKIAEEKTKIITLSGCKTGIYNADNKYTASAIKVSNNKDNIKMLTSGKEKLNNMSYVGYNLSLKGTSFNFFLKSEKSRKALTISINNHLLPVEYRETIAAAILAASETGLTPGQIKESLEKNFTLPESRAAILYGINNSLIIDSSYNASPVTVEGMLEVVKKLKQMTKRPAVILLGDMRELGNEAKNEHEKIAEKLIGTVDYLYCVGPITREYVIQYLNSQISNLNSKFKEVRWFLTFAHAGEYLKEHLPENSIILVKGSQNSIYLEEAIKYILADKEDEPKLCRQENYWIIKKQEFIRTNQF